MKIMLILLYSFINLLSFNYTKTSDEMYVKLTNNIKNISYLSEKFENKEINVLVKFDFDSLFFNYDNIKNDNYLIKCRNEIKNYYMYYNEYIMESLDLTDYNYTTSFYSPHVEILFDNYYEFENDNYKLIKTLNYSSYVEKISINNLLFENNDTMSKDSALGYPFKKALEDIGLSEYEKSGYGIKVGVIETIVPEKNEFYDDDHYEAFFSSATNDRHCFKVSSIIGGETGIAKNIYLYCIAYEGLITCINKLVDEKHVNIINMSMEIKTDGNKSGDYYNDYCEYLDYVINSSKVTIIKSAGNNGLLKEKYITIPGCGLNVITVGASNVDKKVSNISSWETDTKANYLFKPDLVAPGENITLYNPSLSGTSYAAPMVTGIVALLMEEFSILKTDPSLVKSALQVGCNMLNGQTSYYDEYGGFGLVNYSNTRKYLKEGTYKEFEITSNAQNNDLLWSKSVTIKSFGSIEINANWMMISNNITKMNGIGKTPIYSRCKIKLIDLLSDSEVALSELDSNMGFIRYYNVSNVEKNYRIEVRLDGAKKVDSNENGAIIYHTFEHEHNYFYKTINTLKHSRKCVCGDISFGPHIVSANSFKPGERYSRCILCNGKAEIGMIGTLSNNNLSKTINGSYILPNGILVLVDEDVESYLNGTLEIINNYEEI